MNTLSRLVSAFILALPLSFSAVLAAEPNLHAGPLMDHFDQLFGPGTQIEALGPLFQSHSSDTEHGWALPPLTSFTSRDDLDSTECGRDPSDRRRIGL